MKNRQKYKILNNRHCEGGESRVMVRTRQFASCYPSLFLAFTIIETLQIINSAKYKLEK